MEYTHKHTCSTYPAHYPPGVSRIHVEKVDSNLLRKEFRLRQIVDIRIGEEHSSAVHVHCDIASNQLTSETVGALKSLSVAKKNCCKVSFSLPSPLLPPPPPTKKNLCPQKCQ